MNQRPKLEQESEEYLMGIDKGFAAGFREGGRSAWNRLLFYIIFGSFAEHVLWALVSLWLG